MPAGISRERCKRDIETEPGAVAFADLVDIAGAGKQVAAGLVEGEREDAGIGVEDPLHAVAVMTVEVEVQNARAVLFDRGGSGDGGIVVDAKSGGAGPLGVMQ